MSDMGCIGKQDNHLVRSRPCASETCVRVKVLVQLDSMRVAAKQPRCHGQMAHGPWAAVAHCPSIDNPCLARRTPHVGQQHHASVVRPWSTRAQTARGQAGTQPPADGSRRQRTAVNASGWRNRGLQQLAAACKGTHAKGRQGWVDGPDGPDGPGAAMSKRLASPPRPNGVRWPLLAATQSRNCCPVPCHSFLELLCVYDVRVQVQPRVHRTLGVNKNASRCWCRGIEHGALVPLTLHGELFCRPRHSWAWYEYKRAWSVRVCSVSHAVEMRAAVNEGPSSNASGSFVWSAPSVPWASRGMQGVPGLSLTTSARLASSMCQSSQNEGLVTRASWELVSNLDVCKCKADAES